MHSLRAPTLTATLGRIQSNDMIELTSAAKVLAQLKARNAVRDAIRRRGLKVSDYRACELSGWADVYLDEHPELIPEAVAKARGMILEGLLGKRAQRALAETESVRKAPELRTLAQSQATEHRENCR
jgi:hypothetical protein